MSRLLATLLKRIHLLDRELSRFADRNIIDLSEPSRDRLSIFWIEKGKISNRPIYTICLVSTRPLDMLERRGRVYILGIVPDRQYLNCDIVNMWEIATPGPLTLLRKYVLVMRNEWNRRNYGRLVTQFKNVIAEVYYGYATHGTLVNFLKMLLHLYENTIDTTCKI